MEPTDEESAPPNSGLLNLDHLQVRSGLDETDRVEMLKKIKKARDLVFTSTKRRSRRQAIGSHDNIREQESIRKELYSVNTNSIQAQA